MHTASKKKSLRLGLSTGAWPSQTLTVCTFLHICIVKMQKSAHYEDLTPQKKVQKRAHPLWATK